MLIEPVVFVENECCGQGHQHDSGTLWDQMRKIRRYAHHHGMLYQPMQQILNTNSACSINISFRI